jgi:hypothetical protein
MQYKLRADEESAQLTYAEPELQPKLGTPALRPNGNEVPKPAQPEEPRTTSVRQKAMAASAPGSEYWLP